MYRTLEYLNGISDDDVRRLHTVGIRHMVYLALTYDHRLIDGADAGRFLVDVQDRLESGNFDV